MFDRLFFLLGEAFTAMRRNLLMTFAAISTVAISLFLLGGLGYIYFRLSSYADSASDRFDIRVFLRNSATVQDVSTVADQIRRMPGVKSVVWLPKDKMWERDRASSSEYADVENPYPEGLKITLKTLDAGPGVVSQVRQIPQVSDEPHAIVYRGDEQRFIVQVLAVLRWIGITAGGLLFVTAGLLIYNAIRLTIVARRLEVRIMRLVGASGFTILLPFLVEGIVQGAVGGLVAAGLLVAANGVTSDFIAQHSALGHPSAFPVWLVVGLLCGAGAAYGFVCALFASRTPLRFR